MDAHKTYQDGLDDAFDRDIHYRTSFIHAATVIEELMGHCIAWHFCEDEEKHLAFMSLLFIRGEITFSKKIEIFEFIFKESYPDLYEEVPDLINKLHSLRRMRNKFAHTGLMTSKDKEQVGKALLLRYLNRNGKMVDEVISDKDLRYQLAISNEMCWTFIYLFDEIRHRARGGEPRKIKDQLGTDAGRAIDFGV